MPLAKRVIPCLDVTAGRALYDGRLDAREALALVRGARAAC